MKTLGFCQPKEVGQEDGSCPIKVALNENESASFTGDDVENNLNKSTVEGKTGSSFDFKNGLVSTPLINGLCNGSLNHTIENKGVTILETKDSFKPLNIGVPNNISRGESSSESAISPRLRSKRLHKKPSLESLVARLHNNLDESTKNKMEVSKDPPLFKESISLNSSDDLTSNANSSTALLKNEKAYFSNSFISEKSDIRSLSNELVPGSKLNYTNKEIINLSIYKTDNDSIVNDNDKLCSNISQGNVNRKFSKDLSGYTTNITNSRSKNEGSIDSPDWCSVDNSKKWSNLKHVNELNTNNFELNDKTDIPFINFSLHHKSISKEKNDSLEYSENICYINQQTDKDELRKSSSSNTPLFSDTPSDESADEMMVNISDAVAALIGLSEGLNEKKDETNNIDSSKGNYIPRDSISGKTEPSNYIINTYENFNYLDSRKDTAESDKEENSNLQILHKVGKVNKKDSFSTNAEYSCSDNLGHFNLRKSSDKRKSVKRSKSENLNVKYQNGIILSDFNHTNKINCDKTNPSNNKYCIEGKSKSDSAINYNTRAKDACGSKSNSVNLNSTIHIDINELQTNSVNEENDEDLIQHNSCKINGDEIFKKKNELTNHCSSINLVHSSQNFLNLQKCAHSNCDSDECLEFNISYFNKYYLIDFFDKIVKKETGECYICKMYINDDLKFHASQKHTCISYIPAVLTQPFLHHMKERVGDISLSYSDALYGKLIYVCRTCGTLLKSIDSVRLHFNIHKNVYMVQNAESVCHCNPIQYSYPDHKWRMLLLVNDYSCSFCYFHFACVNGLLVHLKISHFYAHNCCVCNIEVDLDNSSKVLEHNDKHKSNFEHVLNCVSFVDNEPLRDQTYFSWNALNNFLNYLDGKSFRLRIFQNLTKEDRARTNIELPIKADPDYAVNPKHIAISPAPEMMKYLKGKLTCRVTGNEVDRYASSVFDLPIQFMLHKKFISRRGRKPNKNETNSQEEVVTREVKCRLPIITSLKLKRIHWVKQKKPSLKVIGQKAPSKEAFVKKEVKVEEEECIRPSSNVRRSSRFRRDKKKKRGRKIEIELCKENMIIPALSRTRSGMQTTESSQNEIDNIKEEEEEEDHTETPEIENIPTNEISGEWVGDHTFVCCSCGSVFLDLAEIMDHKWEAHPGVWCAHTMIRGQDSVPQLFSKQYQPVNCPSEKSSINKKKNVKKKSTVYHCTHCKESFAEIIAFHSHVVECGGLNAIVPVKKKNKKGYRFKRRKVQGVPSQRYSNTSAAPTPNKIGSSNSGTSTPAKGVAQQVDQLPSVVKRLELALENKNVKRNIKSVLAKKFSIASGQIRNKQNRIKMKLRNKEIQKVKKNHSKNRSHSRGGRLLRSSVSSVIKCVKLSSIERRASIEKSPRKSISGNRNLSRKNSNSFSDSEINENMYKKQENTNDFEKKTINKNVSGQSINFENKKSKKKLGKGKYIRNKNKLSLNIKSNVEVNLSQISVEKPTRLLGKAKEESIESPKEKFLESFEVGKVIESFEIKKEMVLKRTQAGKRKSSELSQQEKMNSLEPTQTEKKNTLESTKKDKRKTLESTKTGKRKTLELTKTENKKTLESPQTEKGKAFESTQREKRKTLESTKTEKRKILESTKAEKKKALESTKTGKMKTLEFPQTEKGKALESTQREKRKTLESTQTEKRKTLESTQTEKKKTLNSPQTEKRKTLESTLTEKRKILESTQAEKNKSIEPIQPEKKTMESTQTEKKNRLESTQTEKKNRLESIQTEKKKSLEPIQPEKKKSLEPIQPEKKKSLEPIQPEKKTIESTQTEKKNRLKLTQTEEKKSLEPNQQEKKTIISTQTEKKPLETTQTELKKSLEPIQTEKKKPLELTQTEKNKSLEPIRPENKTKESTQSEKKKPLESTQSEKKKQLESTQIEKNKSLESTQTEKKNALEIQIEKKKTLEPSQNEDKKTLESIHTENKKQLESIQTEKNQLKEPTQTENKNVLEVRQTVKCDQLSQFNSQHFNILHKCEIKTDLLTNQNDINSSELKNKRKKKFKKINSKDAVIKKILGKEKINNLSQLVEKRCDVPPPVKLKRKRRCSRLQSTNSDDLGQSEVITNFRRERFVGRKGLRNRRVNAPRYSLRPPSNKLVKRTADASSSEFNEIDKSPLNRSLRSNSNINDSSDDDNLIRSPKRFRKCNIGDDEDEINNEHERKDSYIERNDLYRERKDSYSNRERKDSCSNSEREISCLNSERKDSCSNSERETSCLNSERNDSCSNIERETSCLNSERNDSCTNRGRKKSYLNSGRKILYSYSDSDSELADINKEKRINIVKKPLALLRKKVAKNPQISDEICQKDFDKSLVTKTKSTPLKMSVGERLSKLANKKLRDLKKGCETIDYLGIMKSTRRKSEGNIFSESLVAKPQFQEPDNDDSLEQNLAQNLHSLPEKIEEKVPPPNTEVKVKARRKKRWKKRFLTPPKRKKPKGVKIILPEAQLVKKSESKTNSDNISVNSHRYENHVDLDFDTIENLRNFEFDEDRESKKLAKRKLNSRSSFSKRRKLSLLKHKADTAPKFDQDISDSVVADTCLKQKYAFDLIKKELAKKPKKKYSFKKKSLLENSESSSANVANDSVRVLSYKSLSVTTCESTENNFNSHKSIEVPEMPLRKRNKSCNNLFEENLSIGSKSPKHPTRNERMPKPDTVENSRQVHVDPVSYFCSDCGLTFDSFQCREDHRQECRTIEFEMSLMAEDLLYECPYCQLTFALKGTQRQHSISCRAKNRRNSQRRRSKNTINSLSPDQKLSKSIVHEERSKEIENEPPSFIQSSVLPKECSPETSRIASSLSSFCKDRTEYTVVCSLLYHYKLSTNDLRSFLTASSITQSETILQIKPNHLQSPPKNTNSNLETLQLILAQPSCSHLSLLFKNCLKEYSIIKMPSSQPLNCSEISAESVDQISITIPRPDLLKALSSIEELMKEAEEVGTHHKKQQMLLVMKETFQADTGS